MMASASPLGALDGKDLTKAGLRGDARPRRQAYGLSRGRARRPIRPNQKKMGRAGQRRLGQHRGFQGWSSRGPGNLEQGFSPSACGGGGFAQQADGLPRGLARRRVWRSTTEIGQGKPPALLWKGVHATTEQAAGNVWEARQDRPAAPPPRNRNWFVRLSDSGGLETNFDLAGASRSGKLKQTSVDGVHKRGSAVRTIRNVCRKGESGMEKTEGLEEWRRACRLPGLPGGREWGSTGNRRRP